MRGGASRGIRRLFSREGDYFSFSEDELRRRGERAKDDWGAATPFPYVVLDDFLPVAVAERLLREFPPPGAMHCEDSSELRRAGKYRSHRESGLSGFTRHVLYHLNSAPFIEFLQDVTGIDGLLADPDVDGSLRHFRRGGRLGLHIDSNWHPGLRLHRRVNLLYYLNKGWRTEWHGGLELWEENGDGPAASIAPLFNRCVIFAPTRRTLHGFPAALQCPEGETRKSMQLYYYSVQPADQENEPHGTLFR